MGCYEIRLVVYVPAPIGAGSQPSHLGPAVGLGVRYGVGFAHAAFARRGALSW
jgi:hypothetical protein